MSYNDFERLTRAHDLTAEDPATDCQTCVEKLAVEERELRGQLNIGRIDEATFRTMHEVARNNILEDHDLEVGLAGG